MFMFVGCDILTTNIETKPGIIGTWWSQATKEMVVFNSENRGIWSQYSAPSLIVFSFEVDDSEVIVSRITGQYELSFSYDGTDTFLDNNNIGFVRIKGNDVVGIWKYGDIVYYYVLAPNGEGMLRAGSNIRKLKYTVNGNSIIATLLGEDGGIIKLTYIAGENILVDNSGRILTRQ